MVHHRKPDCLVNKLDYLEHQVKVSAKVQYVNMCLSTQYLLNQQKMCCLTWYCNVLSWARVSCKKISLLSSRSRSQQGLIWSKCDSFYCIFLTADPFATKLGLIVHYHKPECIMKKLDCCVQGHGHSKKILNVRECLSRWYFLNHWTLHYQTWCGDAVSWARLSSKKIGLPSSKSRRAQWNVI